MQNNSLSPAHVKIFLDSIEVPLRIGIYDHEKNVPQRALVDVELYADPAVYLKTVNLDTIIDYAVLYKAINSWAERPQVLLIEDYLKELLDLCFEYKIVMACRASIRKMDVFGKDQGAGVEVFMKRDDWLLG
ncbi:MAG: dihydroneopterin aldolase [Micavibrio sp.]|nr:dihydroneopterin aldolase [Micavibrio sp.]